MRATSSILPVAHIATHIPDSSRAKLNPLRFCASMRLVIEPEHPFVCTGSFDGENHDNRSGMGKAFVWSSVIALRIEGECYGAISPVSRSVGVGNLALL